MELKSITTRYDNATCAKCSREIKKGWTVFFDPKKKVVYCKPCGDILSKGGRPVDDKPSGDMLPRSDSELLLNELAGNIGLFNDTIAKFSLSLATINESLEEIKKGVEKLLKAKKGS